MATLIYKDRTEEVRGLSSFSSIDLRTNPDSPGICFPFGPIPENDIANKPSFSSIMLHKENGKTIIGHTEYRTAIMKSNDNLAYTKHPSVTCVQAKAGTISQIATVLGLKPKVNSYITLDEITNNNIEILNIHDLVLSTLEAMNYNASTKYIFEDNVTKKQSTSTLASIWESSYKKNQKIEKEIQVPHRNSKLWKKVAKEIEDFYDIKLIPFIEVNKLTTGKKSDYYEELYVAYNGVLLPTEVEPSNTDILTLQNKLWLTTHSDMQQALDDSSGLFDEAQEPISNINKDLISWGIDQKLIVTSSETYLRDLWHKIEDQVNQQ